MVPSVWTVASGLDILGLVNPCVLGTHPVTTFRKRILLRLSIVAGFSFSLSDTLLDTFAQKSRSF